MAADAFYVRRSWRQAAPAAENMPISTNAAHLTEKDFGTVDESNQVSLSQYGCPVPEVPPEAIKQTRRHHRISAKSSRGSGKVRTERICDATFETGVSRLLRRVYVHNIPVFRQCFQW